MKRKIISLVVSAALLISPVLSVSASGGGSVEEKKAVLSEESAKLELWYNKPATNYNWVSSSSTKPSDLQPLVIGNGYMGAAIYGDLKNEKLQLSEKTIWKSGPNSRPDYTGGNKTGGNKLIPELREAAFKYDQDAVDKIMDTGLLLGKGYERGSYQTFGNLNLIFDEAPSAIPGDYHRYLDLENALSGVTYSHDGVTYTREYLANYPDNVMAFKLTASEPGKLSFTMNLEPLVTEKITSGKETKVNVKKEIEQDNTLTVTANVKSNNMKLASRVRVLNDGGTLSATENKDIHIDGADSVVLLMTIGTDYKNEYPNYVGEDPLPGVIERIEEATKKGYETLKERHIDDYKKLFDTVRIDLGQFDNGLPTNELLGQYQEGFKAGDLSDSKYREFEMLAYQFGRYALIASSRAGSLPANLQGVWNDNNNPMFSSDYHLNVNLEMNYWEAMNANMGDTMIPLIDYVDGLRAPGSVTAFEYTGIEKGWMTNCSSSPLGYTAPYNHYNYALNPASSAWICANIYDYYLFTGDEQMLRDRIYPIMRGAAEYLSELLVEDPRDGSLVVAPSFSSEHGPVTVGTTYEQSLTYQLFENVIESSKVVGEKDTEFIKKLAEQKERLDPIRIGEWGQIKEWREEDIVEIGRLGNMEGEGEDQHRHTSHLVCLYPLFMVTPETPDEFAAAKVSLTKRGNAQTGWSRAMKMNEWARLLDGKNAMECFSGILAERTLSNMFDTHPPFQIDGTLGLSAGVTEMLLQSHAGYIQPIPALPEEWISGSYEGLMARGNFEVDAEWEENALTLMKVRSNKGKDLKLRYNNIKDSVVVDSKGNRISFTVEDDNTITFTTIEGETYTITPNKRVSSAYQVAAPSEKEEPVPTSYGAAYSIPAGFENIGVADEELPISRVALEGEDEADIRMYYDSAKGDLSFIAYQLPDKNKTAVVQIIDRSNGEVIAQQMIDVKHFSGFQADFKVPANLDGTYEVLISIDRSADYVSRIFTLKSGKDVYDLASLTQEYERTKCLRGIDYTDESWKMLQSTREKALALLEGEKMPSLKEMTTAREQMAYAREKLADRYQTKTLVATSSEVQKTGNWQNSGTKIVSDAAGDTLTVPFYGEGITVMGRSNTDCGKIEVYLDGQLDKTVDLYSFEETNDSCSLYQKKGLPLGDHTLTIKHVDGRNYATGNRVVINQFNLDVPAKGVLVKGDNLLLNKPAEASNYYKNNAQYGPSAVVDGNQSTRWATDDNVSPITITFDLQKETAFNYLVIMEAASFANRVSGYQVEAEIDGEWKKIAEGGGVGANLGVELPDTIATKLRIEFTMSGAAGVTLSEVELYQAFYEEESAQSVADDLCVYQPAYGASSVTTSVVPEGYKVDLISSSNQKVVALDGTITTPTEDTEVTLTYRVTKTADGSTGEKTDTLTVRAKAALTAEQVAKMLSVQQPTSSSTVLIPSILPAGYHLSISSTSNQDVIDSTGAITRPKEETAVSVTYRVTKLDDQTVAERTIEVTVPVEDPVEDTVVECDDESIVYSTAISSATAGVKNQWFYSMNVQDQGGKCMAYNYQSGDAPWFEITFAGEQITILSRSKNDQSNFQITIRDDKGNEVETGIANCKEPNGAYQTAVYTSGKLPAGTYILRAVSQPSKAGEYTVVDGFKISGRKGGVEADRTELNEVIAEAAKWIADSKLDGFFYEQKRLFMDAYNNMILIRDNELATQEEINTRIEKMKSVLESISDREAADKVIQKIDAIGTVTLNSEKAIEEARKAYEGLTDSQKALISDEKVKVLTEAEKALADLKDNKSDQEAADSVAAKINGIGTVTLDSEEVIREAREAYEGLTDNQKELISLEQLKVLIEAEKTLKELKENKANQEAADSVTAKINGIGTVTLDSEEAVREAREAYEGLTDSQKALISQEQVEVLIKAEETLIGLKTDKAKAEAVVEKIDAVGTVTLDSRGAIEEARAAYDALTESQKAMISAEKLSVLTEAEIKFAELVDGDAAGKVIELIDKIGEVSIASEAEIMAVRNAYESLTESQRELVNNLSILENAENVLEGLKTDKAAVDSVKEQIAALGNVTLEDEAKVRDARNAYEALTESQKAQVDNIQVLQQAEKKIIDLKNEKPPVTVKPVQIAQPRILSVKSSIANKATGRVKISFKKPPMGQEVKVYRQVGKNRKLIGTTKSGYLYDNAPASGKKALYYIKVISKDTTKYLDSTNSKKVSINLPSNPRKVLAKQSGKRQVKITWSKVKGADKYYIYRSSSKNKEYVRIATAKAAKRTYVDKKAKAGKKYYYKVVVKKSSKYSGGKVSRVVKVKK